MSKTPYRIAALTLVLSIMFIVSQGGQDGRIKTVRGEKPASAEKPASIEKERKKDPTGLEVRIRALYIAQSLATSDDTDDIIQAAHMKAAFATLLCANGNDSIAIGTLKQSFERLTAEALKLDESEDSKRAEISELALNLVETATKCDPGARSWFVNRLERLTVDESPENKSIVSKDEQPVVSDQLWGSRPSMRRVMAAQILSRAAHEKIEQKQIEQSQKLLDQSLNYCVVTPFITALAALHETRPDLSLNLFIRAAQKVRAMPSGAEMSDLSFGFRPILGLTLNQLGDQTGKILENKAAFEMYLDAMTALVQGPNSYLAGKSPDTLRMVKSILPLYSLLRIQTTPQIEAWIAESSLRLPPDERYAVETAPFVPPPASIQISNIEDIAFKSNDEKERDQAYAALASIHMQRRKFDAASEYASRIVEIALKQQVLDELHFFKLSSMIDDKSDFLSLYQEVGRIASVTLRTKANTILARAICKSDPQLAIESLQEATRLALKLDPSPVRSHLLLRVASTYGEFDMIGLREVLNEAVRSINSSREQSQSKWGGIGVETITVRYDPKWRFPRISIDDPEYYKRPYDFSVFGKLALADFDGASILADHLSDKLARASALYEICASTLLDKKSTP